MSDPASDLLIVIPCLNEEAALPALLARQLVETQDVPIVVVDGGSTDASRTIVERIAADNPSVHLLANPRRLQSAGINLAVRHFGAGRRWLLRLDAHCDYPPNYAERLLAAAEVHAATSVVVPMVSRGVTCFQIAAATAQNSRLGTGGSPHRHVGAGGYVDHGHHALIDLALFQQVGGYLEDMPHNEDAELDQRLLAAGGRIWLEPRLALTYYPRRSVGALWRQYRGYGRGRARTLRLHRTRPKLRQLLPLAVPAAIVLAIGAPLYPLLALPLVVWALGCLAAGAIIGIRAGGCAMATGIAAMCMHAAWGIGFVREALRRR